MSSPLKNADGFWAQCSALCGGGGCAVQLYFSALEKVECGEMCEYFLHDAEKLKLNPIIFSYTSVKNLRSAYTEIIT